MRRIGMTEHRQAEGRLADEDVARDEFERRAGRVAHALIIAGNDNAHALGFDADLRRPKHVAGGMKRDGEPIHADALAIPSGLRGAGEIGPAAHAHDREGLARCEHAPMSGARVVGMAMRDQRTRDRPQGIDVKIAGGAIEACRRLLQ